MAKFYYNGVLLPEIPADKLTSLPYCWIRLSSGVYDLIMSPHPWYYNNSLYTTKSAYSCYRANAESEEWTFRISYNDHGQFPIDDGIIWSNHDIPSGSATSTTLYLQGSEPVPESGGETPDILYIVNGSDLTAVADAIRAKGGTTDELAFPGGFVSAVEGIGGGELVLPENARLYYVGNAVSVMDASSLSFESSAVGVLQEE